HPVVLGVVRVDLPAESLSVELLEPLRIRPSHFEPSNWIGHLSCPSLVVGSAAMSPRHAPQYSGKGEVIGPGRPAALPSVTALGLGPRRRPRPLTGHLAWGACCGQAG